MNSIRPRTFLVTRKFDDGDHWVYELTDRRTKRADRRYVLWHTKGTTEITASRDHLHGEHDLTGACDVPRMMTVALAVAAGVYPKPKRRS